MSDDDKYVVDDDEHDVDFARPEIVMPINVETTWQQTHRRVWAILMVIAFISFEGMVWCALFNLVPWTIPIIQGIVSLLMAMTSPSK